MKSSHFVSNSLKSVFIIVGFVFVFSPFAYGQSQLSLQHAIDTAITNDPWLVSNTFKQSAMEDSSIAAGTLPDPRLSLGLANFPIDTFNFNQEPMTQARFEVMQRFPRGDSRALQQQRLNILSQQFPWQRQQRRAQVQTTVSRLWLDTYFAQASMALINRDRNLFEQLVDVAQASYSSTARRTRQQDIVRAQLELTRLDDRLTVLRQQQDRNKQQLSEWLDDNLLNIEVSNTLPQIPLTTNTIIENSNVRADELQKILLRHPQILAMDEQIAASATDIDIAKQQYKPEWGLSASYGYRDDAPNGVDRADFFSIGVNFDLPIFTGNKQDKQVSAAVSSTEALKTDKTLMLRALAAQFRSTYVNLRQLLERQQLYQQQLLPQMNEQAEASLTAYTNDDGDFSEVMRARIAELNANIDALKIDVEIQKHIAQLNYFLTGSQNNGEQR